MRLLTTSEVAKYLRIKERKVYELVSEQAIPIEDGNANVKAETCGACHTYLKVLPQQRDPALDPVADDVASLALDLLVRELGFSRGGVNPFLLGY